MARKERRPKRMQMSVYRRLNHKNRKDRVRCRICGEWFKAVNHFHLRKHGMTVAEYKEQFGVAYVVAEETRFCLAEQRLAMFPIEVLAGIRRRHRNGLSLFASDMEEQDSRLLHAAVLHFDSWPEALRATGLDPERFRKPRPPPVWTTDRVIQSIEARRERGHSLKAKAVGKEDCRLLGASQRLFGCWYKALRAAGLTPTEIREIQRRKWTRALVVERIGRRQEEGKALNAAAVLKDDAKLLNTGTKIFGNWARALRAAGLDPKIIQRAKRWNKAKVRQGILARHRDKLPLNSHAVAKEDWNLWCAGSRYFGSWNNALKAAGLDSSAIRQTLPAWTRERILAAIQERAEDGKPLNRTAIHPRSLVDAARRMFGSWDQALRVAGLDPRHIRLARPHGEWTPELVIRDIRREHKRGQPMHRAAVARRNGALVGAASKHLGSWEKALKAAGLDPEKITNPRTRKWTADMVVHAILARKKNRKDLNLAAINKNDPVLMGAAQRCFGNWNQALRAAGLDPDKIRLGRRWDPTKIVRAIRKRRREKKPLQSKAMSQEDPGLWSSAIKRFGSWPAALRAAGFDPDAIRLTPPRWTRERILATIQERARKNEPLLAAVKPYSLVLAARRILGSWDEALRAAGLNSGRLEAARSVRQ